jgi:hypothetical protein
MENEAHKINHENISNVPLWVDFVVKHAILIVTFLFSLVVKIHNMMAYKKRMTATQCTMEGILCGLGGALTIYVLYKINAPLIILCGVGGFSSLLVNPIATIITKEATPVLELIVAYLKKFLRKYLKNKME